MQHRSLKILALASSFALTACAGGARYQSEPSVLGAYLQGRYAAQSYDLPAAEAAFEEVARGTEAPRGARTAFGYALALGDIDEAAAQARRILADEAERQPNDAPSESGIAADLPRLTLASQHMARGQAAEAAALLDGTMASSLGTSLGVLLRSAAIFETDGLKAATAILSEQEAGTFRGLVPIHAALLLELSGDYDDAEGVYERALWLPRRDMTAIAYARFLERQGQRSKAESIYRTMVRDADLLSRAGRMGLARLGMVEGESDVFRDRAKRSPRPVEDAEGLFALALENLAWLGFEQAVATPATNSRGEQRQRAELIVPLGLANLARYVDPDRNAADYLAALIFSFYGTPEIAIEAADAVPPESWLYGYVILEKANAAQDAGTAEDAIAILRQASRAEKRPEPQWALQLHILLAAEGRYDEADEAGTVAIREAERLGVLPSSLWRYYFARGANRLDAGRDEAAFADLEKTLELAPDEPIILNHLGYSYVERAQQLERAFGMIERAVEIEPQNGSIVDSLGWAYFQRGFYDKAVERLEEAVQLEPADAVITDHLGDAYFMTGRSRDAQYEWRRVLSLEDADDELRSAAAAKLEGDYSSSPTLEGVEAR